jgi:hypothetical protein
LIAKQVEAKNYLDGLEKTFVIDLFLYMGKISGSELTIGLQSVFEDSCRFHIHADGSHACY